MFYLLSQRNYHSRRPDLVVFAVLLVDRVDRAAEAGVAAVFVRVDRAAEAAEAGVAAAFERF